MEEGPESCPKADGPFKVLQRIGENSYKIELPRNYGVSATFNVSDLSHCIDNYNNKDSKMSPFKLGENDAEKSKFRKYF